MMGVPGHMGTPQGVKSKHAVLPAVSVAGPSARGMLGDPSSISPPLPTLCPSALGHLRSSCIQSPEEATEHSLGPQRAPFTHSGWQHTNVLIMSI